MIFEENSSLESAGQRLFVDCDNVIVYVKPGMKLNIDECIEDTVIVHIPSYSTMVRGTTLGKLRDLRDARLPDGLPVIGEKLFACSDIESVTVPANIIEIQEEAFACCRKLKQVFFDERGKLERLERCCFCYSGLESIKLPKSVKVIGEKAFSDCAALKCVSFEERS